VLSADGRELHQKRKVQLCRGGLSSCKEYGRVVFTRWGGLQNMPRWWAKNRRYDQGEKKNGLYREGPVKRSLKPLGKVGGKSKAAWPRGVSGVPTKRAARAS